MEIPLNKEYGGDKIIQYSMEIPLNEEYGGDEGGGPNPMELWISLSILGGLDDRA